MSDIKRIYEIEVQGVKTGLQELSLFSTTFDTLDAQVVALKKQLNFAQTGGDATLVESLKKQISGLQSQLDLLSKSKSALTKETALLNQAENTEAINTQANTKAKKELTDVQNTATKTTQTETDAAEQQEEQYKTLSQRIKELNVLREQSRTTGKPIVFEDISLTDEQAVNQIQRLKALQNDLNSEVRVGKDIRDENNLAEQESLTLLTKQRVEIEAIIAGKKEGSSVVLNGEVLTYAQIVEKLQQIKALEDAEKSRIESLTATLKEEPIQLEKQISQYQQLIQARKQLEDITASTQLAGGNTLDFQGQTLSIEQAIRKVQEMKIQEQALIDQFKIEKGVHDAINIAEENSITKIKAQAVELSQVLNNRASGATNVTFQGQTIGIVQAQAALAGYQKTIADYNQQERLRKQAIDIVNGSMRDLEAQTKILTSANINLTASDKELGLSLTQLQWNSIRASIVGIAPELAGLTLEEVNAGKASDILTAKIFSNNAALRDFKLSISGSNTLVGDYTKGIIDAFKNLGLGNVLSKEKADVDFQIKQIVVRINDLREAWQKGFKDGDVGLQKIEKDLQDAAALHTQLTTRVKSLNTAFESTNTIGNQITSSIGQGFKNLDQTIGRTLFTYIGFQAAITGVQRLIQTDKQLSDQSADLQRTLGATAAETNNVIESLKELNTRTSLTALQGFATIAARAGVATDRIAGVTSAINKLQLVAGSELGDIDTATTSIVKLINIFQGAGAVTEDSVLKIGNALVKLSNEGVASGQFLVNFSERLAGIHGATNISQASVLGLAAAFEETGQTSEIAASAVSQVLNRISADVPKYAKLAGQATESFRKILRDNPAEAIIQLSEGLRKGGTEADQLGEEFNKLGLTGVRIRNTLQDIGANADFFRKRITDATLALVDQNTILDGSANKQLTFAATIDKIGASLTKTFDNPTFVNLLNNIGLAVEGLINLITRIPFQVIIIGISALTAAWAVYKGQVVSTTLAEALVNKQSALNGIARLAERLGLVSLTEAQKLKQIQDQIEISNLKTAIVQRELAAGASEAEAIATAEAAVATTALNTALKLSPIGIVLGLLALLLPLIGAFAAKTDESRIALNKQNEALKSNLGIQTQIAAEVKNQTDKTISIVKNLIEVIKDESLTLGTRKQAYQQLIQIAPEFQSVLENTIVGFGNEKLAIENLNGEYDKFIAKIGELARARALATVGEKVNQDLIQKQVEEEKAKNDLIAAQDKAQEDKAKHTTSTGKINPLAKASIDADQKDLDDAKEALQKATLSAKQQQILVDTYNKIRSKTVSDLDIQLKDINEKLKTVAKGSKEEHDLIEQQTDLQNRINAALGAQDKTAPVSQDDAIDALKGQLENVKSEIQQTIEIIEALKKKNNLTSEQQLELSEDNQKLTNLYKERSDLQKRLKALGVVDNKSTATGRVQVERDDFNLIETIRAKDIAEENLRVAKITQIHKLSLDEETTHLENLQKINDTADNAKVAKLTQTLNTTNELERAASGKKLENLKSDAIREEKEIAEAQLAIATREEQINEQIIALRQKALDEQIKIQKRDLDSRKSDLQLVFQSVVNTPDVSAKEVADAQKTLHESIIAETIQHYNTLISLAKKFNISTEVLEDEKNRAINDALKSALNDERDIYQSFFKDVDTQMDKNISSINDRLNSLRDNILNSSKPSRVQTAKLDVIDNIQQALDATERLTESTKKYNKALEDLKSLQDKDVVQSKNEAQNQAQTALNNASKAAITLTNQEVQALHDAMTKAHLDLKSALDTLNQGIEQYGSASQTITSLVGNLFSKVFKVNAKDNTEEINKKTSLQKLLGETIADTFQFATTAMNNYFDSEKNRIDASNNAIKNRLDIELNQQKVRAQSQAEQDTLDRKYAQKKKDADRKAFDENKKLQLAQAKINFGIALSNIILSTIASLNPANLISLGVAGDIAYAVQAGLALATYISTVSNIQSAQFSGAYGLQAQRGGKVKGNTHAQGGEKFGFNGTIYEDEVGEIRVIRTKDSDPKARYHVQGTQAQIASFINQAGGGINFEPGAYGSRLEFGGSISQINKFASGGSILSLAPPSNPSSFLNNNNTGSDTELRSLVVGIANEIKGVNDAIEKQADSLSVAYNTINRRIDNIKVHVISKEIETTNSNNKKAKSIGTIG